MRAVDRAGERFGRLTVIERAENDKYGRSRWLCRCDCGNEKVVQNGNLRTGVSSSCGCFRKERAARIGKENAGENSPVWKGGYDSPHCRCVRALTESRKKSATRGYAPCNATLEQLLPTITDRCQFCGVPECELGRRLCLEHDHATGAFRGWVCDRCNRLIGTVERYHEKVKAYLERNHATR